MRIHKMKQKTLNEKEFKKKCKRKTTKLVQERQLYFQNKAGFKEAAGG